MRVPLVGLVLVVCALASGASVATTAAHRFVPCGSLVIAQDGEARVVLDDHGETLFRIEDTSATILPCSTGLALFDGKALEARARDGKTAWSVKLFDVLDLGYQDFVEYRIAPLPGGDFVAIDFCPMADSGVNVVRLDGKTGAARWKANCKELGVAHSKYHHEAWVDVFDDRVVVTSEASGGIFAETLSATDGTPIARFTR